MKRMKLMAVTAFVLFASICYSQQQEQQTVAPAPSYFVQGLLEISTETQTVDLQTEMRNIQGLQVVRLDFHSKRFFILTDGLSGVDETQVETWFGDHADDLKCLQIGVYGVDAVNKFPFENCQ